MNKKKKYVYKSYDYSFYYGSIITKIFKKTIGSELIKTTLMDLPVGKLFYFDLE